MKILGAMRQSVAHGGIGGMELVSHDVYSGLVQCGHQVEVITTAIPNMDVDFKIIDGVKYIFIKNAPIGVYSSEYHKGVVRYFSDLSDNSLPDIIHSVSGGAKFLTQNSKGIPVVATWHGTNFEQELDKLMKYVYINKGTLLPIHVEKFVFGSLFGMIYNNDFLSFNGHIVISDFMKNCVQLYGVDPRDIYNVPNALPNYFLTKSNVNKKEISKKKNILGVIGRINDMKGHLFFVEVLKKLDPENFEVIVIGSGEDKKAYQELSLKCHFVQANRQDMPDLYSNIDIFVNPTFRNTGFDLTIQEALVSGCPVLVSNIAPYRMYYEKLLAKFGEKTPLFTFNVGDIDSCVNAINRMIVNKVKNEYVDYFIKEYDFNKMIDRYSKIFKAYAAQNIKNHRFLEGLVNIAQKEENWEEVIVLSKQFQEQFPNLFHSYLWLGRAYGQLNKYKDAKSEFKILKEKFPNDHRGIEGLVNIAQKEENWEEVIKLSQKFQQEFPKNWRGLFWRGYSLKKLGKYTEAKDCFFDLITEFPNDIYGYKGLVEISVVEQKWNDVLLYSENIVSLQGHQKEVYSYKVSAWKNISKYEFVENYILHLLQTEPNNIQYLLDLSDIYHLINEDEKSVKFLEKAMDCLLVSRDESYVEKVVDRFLKYNNLNDALIVFNSFFKDSMTVNHRLMYLRIYKYTKGDLWYLKELESIWFSNLDNILVAKIFFQEFIDLILNDRVGIDFIDYRNIGFLESLCKENLYNESIHDLLIKIYIIYNIYDNSIDRVKHIINQRFIAENYCVDNLMLETFFNKKIQDNLNCFVTYGGGLGNQLYYLSFANYLKDRKFKVSLLSSKKISIGNTLDKTKRNLILELPKILGFDVYFIEDIKLIGLLQKFNNAVSLLSQSYGRFAVYDEFKSLNDNDGLLFARFWGSFQSYHYLRVGFKEEIQKSISSLIVDQNKYSIGDNDVALHIRRGDFLDYKLYNFIGIDFYLKALGMINNISQIYLFSDDFSAIEIEISILSKYYNVICIKDQSVLDDLYLMMQFSRYVLGNSTFAWWGALLSLNDDLDVIVPKYPWCQDIVSYEGLSNYPVSWRQVDNSNL